MSNLPEFLAALPNLRAVRMYHVSSPTIGRALCSALANCCFPTVHSLSIPDGLYIIFPAFPNLTTLACPSIHLHTPLLEPAKSHLPRLDALVGMRLDSTRDFIATLARDFPHLRALSIASPIRPDDKARSLFAFGLETLRAFTHLSELGLFHRPDPANVHPLEELVSAAKVVLQASQSPDTKVSQWPCRVPARYRSGTIHGVPASVSKYPAPECRPVVSRSRTLRGRPIDLPVLPPQHPGANQSHNLWAYSSPSAPLSSGATSPKQSKRRSYHPKPPAQRSEWVMWVGNIPSEAVHDEVWRFFTRDEGGSASTEGVLSIFLISRSCCAFVNYATQAHLDAAIAQFNGVPLRAEPRCLLLVCRARRKDDELRAGVGGQRGMGMHARWVKEQAEKEGSVPSASAPDSGTASPSALTDNVPTWPPRRERSDSSPSQASTSSSILREHFPQRFFILKALTQTDLDLSVQTGVWATQKHNEGVLDLAFRTSKDVFLIFSVNKSGEFYGYARMAGPVATGHGDDGTPPLFSADRFVADSPAPLTTPSPAPVRSAPAVLGAAHHPLSAASDAALKGKSATLDADWAVRASAAARGRGTLVLDETAPFRAARAGADAPGEGDGEARGGGHGHGHGHDFELQWLCTERLPFQRTRHLRNPWNHDREVKISRDGTELEPMVGRVLLEEWGVYLNSNEAEAAAEEVWRKQTGKAGRGRGKGPWS
ncbi:YT521-B-like domain-containing protein [Mycena capillaripes]|nr:YT521-B-like domain-containing protein [Mycena capillaripes]